MKGRDETRVVPCGDPLCSKMKVVASEEKKSVVVGRRALHVNKYILIY